MALSRQRYPQFFDADVEESMKMFDTGFCYPLEQRDEQGRRIVLVQIRKWNPNVHSVYDAIRLYCYVYSVLLEEEETQIAGIISVYDYTGITMKHLMSPSDLLDVIDFIHKCTAVRDKGDIVMNLPSFAQILVEITLSSLNEKVKKRLLILKQGAKLSNHISAKLLPKEFGGVQSEADMMKAFLKLRDEHREKLHEYFSFKIDYAKVSRHKFSASRDEVGSFRKLEID